MHDHASHTPHEIPSHTTRVSRARSLPSAKPFRVAVVCTSIHYLGLVVAVTASGCFFLQPSQAASRILVGGIVFSAVTWLVAFFKRRSTFCPLCKGTPLLNTGARTHVRARRVFPLNHGTTATLSIMCCQKFRCMYCGSDYDLLKPRTRLLYQDDGDR